MLFSIKTTKAKTYEKIVCDLYHAFLNVYNNFLYLFMYVLDVNAIILPY
jgi:hypothetical protein